MQCGVRVKALDDDPFGVVNILYSVHKPAHLVKRAVVSCVHNKVVPLERSDSICVRQN